MEELDLFSAPEAMDLFESAPEEIDRTTNSKNVDFVSRMAGVALTKPESDVESFLERMRSNTESARKLIGEGNESVLRREAATNELKEDLEAVYGMRYDDAVPANVRSHVDTAARNVITADHAAREQAALERQFMNRLEDLAVSDPVQAQVITNRYEMGSPLEVVRDINTKRLILGQVINEVAAEVEDTGWLGLTAGFLLGMIPKNSAMANIGNVGMPRGFLDTIQDFFVSTDRVDQEGMALWDMSTEDFAKAVRGDVFKNTLHNATTLLFQDKTKQLQLLSQLDLGGFQGFDRSLNTVFDVVDDLTLVPFTGAARLLSIPTTMIRAGARQETARLVAEAADLAVREGTEAAVAKTGLAMDDVVQGMSVRATDPEAVGTKIISTGPDAGRVIDEVAEMQRQLPATLEQSRWFDDGEKIKAIEALQKRVENDLGVPVIKDVEVEDIKVASGQTVSRVTVTVGDEAGNLFPTKLAAEDALHRMGRAGRVVEERGTPPAPEPAKAPDVNPAVEAAPVPKKASKNAVAKAEKELEDLKAEYNANYSKLTQEDKIAYVPRLEDAYEKVRVAKAGATPETPAVAPTAEVDTVVQDLSGAYAIKLDLNVPETGFYVNLNTPESSHLGRRIRDARQISDRTLADKAQHAGNARNKLQKQLQTDFARDLHKLNRNEREALSAVWAKGEQMGVWFNDDQIRSIYSRAFGRLPNDRELQAYRTYQTVNDLEYAMRNDVMFTDKLVRGVESAEFKTNGLGEFDIDVIFRSEPKATGVRVYNISDDVHYAGSNPLTQLELDKLRARGYELFESADEAILLADGVKVDTFVAKKSDIVRKPLRRVQLNYRPGGHRMYADKYFVKQTKRGRQPDTGKEYLDSPVTLRTAATAGEGREWARIMNEALDMIRAGKSGPEVDDFLRSAPKHIKMPTARNILDDIESGRLSKDEKLEVVFDRELPEEYRKAGVADRFGRDDESGFEGWLRSTGRMYYSKKGETLESVNGDGANVLDPYETMAKSLHNIANLSTFSDYKITSVTRWVKKFGEHLNLRDLAEDEATSPMRVFVNATVKNDVPEKLKQTIEAQRDVINRILGFKTPYERQREQYVRNVAEWVAGDGDNELRKWASGQVYNWFFDKSPLNYLRGFAFDLKLGMFNVGQFFIQTSTSWAAIAMSPRLGLKGAISYWPMRAYLMRPDENVLSAMAPRVYKLVGFDTEAEFKQYARTMAKSGFFDLGDNHLLINSYGPNSAYGSFSGVKQVREFGRVPFYEAEIVNRTVAYRIAYGQAMEEMPKANRNSARFLERVAGLAEDYSFRMSEQSASWWQKGVLSVPTQFWAYNIRMLEAMFGKTFTPQQRMRLVTSQFMLFGSAGIPLLSAATDWYHRDQGEAPDITTLTGQIDRGLMDTMVHELTGADILLSEKYGTGAFLTDTAANFLPETIKDMFNLSSYGEKSTAELMFGATGSIFGGLFTDVIRYAAYESGASDQPVDGEILMRMLKEVSTVNNGLKAMMALEYGKLINKKGETIAPSGSLPSESAVFIALGFQPGLMDEMDAYSTYMKDRKESIDDAAKIITKYRVEAMDNNELFEEKMKQVNAFVRLLPPEIRQDAIKQAHRYTPQTSYESMSQRMMKIKQKEEMTDAVQ